MNLQQIEQMESALAESSKKPWSAFTDDSRDRPHTNIIGVVPHTHCVLSLSGHHKSEPNVTLAALAPDMAAHIIAQREQIEALEKRVKAADAEYRRGFEDGCAHMKEDYEAGERLDSHRRAGQ